MCQRTSEIASFTRASVVQRFQTQIQYEGLTGIYHLLTGHAEFFEKGNHIFQKLIKNDLLTLEQFISKVNLKI
jgi:hypothetical protein